MGLDDGVDLASGRQVETANGAGSELGDQGFAGIEMNQGVLLVLIAADNPGGKDIARRDAQGFFEGQQDFVGRAAKRKGDSLLYRPRDHELHARGRRHSSLVLRNQAPDLQDIFDSKGFGEGKDRSAPEDFARSTAFDQSSPVQDSNALADQHRFVGVVGDVDDGQIHLVPDSKQVGEHPGAQGDIQGGQGFIEEESPGTRCQGPPQGDPAALAPGEFIDPAAEEVPDFEDEAGEGEEEKRGARALSADTPARRRPKARFSATSRWGKRVGAWGTQPRARSSTRNRAPAP